MAAGGRGGIEGGGRNGSAAAGQTQTGTKQTRHGQTAGLVVTWESVNTRAAFQTGRICTDPKSSGQDPGTTLKPASGEKPLGHKQLATKAVASRGYQSLHAEFVPSRWAQFAGGAVVDTHLPRRTQAGGAQACTVAARLAKVQMETRQTDRPVHASMRCILSTVGWSRL